MTMLRSYVFKHRIKDRPFNLVLIENSTDDKTRDLLRNYGIPFISNPGGTHSPSVDLAIMACRTKYALLVDTDIVFRMPIYSFLKRFDSNKNPGIAGQIVGSRGGYNLKKRVQPWFCLINIEAIKKHGIKFHDTRRIKESGSDHFYSNIPLDENKLDTKHKLYDVGCSFYEDIFNAKLKTFHILDIEMAFRHYIGSSWIRNVGDMKHARLARKTIKEYRAEINRFKGVEIRGCFK